MNGGDEDKEVCYSGSMTRHVCSVEGIYVFRIFYVLFFMWSIKVRGK